MKGSPAPLRLVPETSPVSGWTPLIEQTDLQSYSYLLPFETPGDLVGGVNNNNNNNNNSWISESQLDRWWEALHPSQYEETAQSEDVCIQSKHCAAWTDAYYKGERLLRKTAWVSLPPDCTCEYGYSDTWQTQATDPNMLAVVQEMTSIVQRVTGCSSFNSCNLNYYPQGGGVGWHADDEFLFDGRRRHTCIVSLSLCCKSGRTASRDHGARQFMIQPQTDHEENVQGKYTEDDIKTVILRHGDLLTMEGKFQNFYFHSVWPGDSQEYSTARSEGKEGPPFTQGERINLTWRTIVQHLNGSEEECRGKTCPLSASNVPST